jgi:hypothetical protein
MFGSERGVGRDPRRSQRFQLNVPPTCNGEQMRWNELARQSRLRTPSGHLFASLGKPAQVLWVVTSYCRSEEVTV